jgi:cytochrome c oxidase subunit 2
MFGLEKYLGLPVNASADKSQVDQLLLFVHVLMVTLFIGWFCYFVFVLCKFNKKRNLKADHFGMRSHFSSYIEVGVALIEAGLLLGLAIPLWAKTVDSFPKGPDVTTIKVIGQQFLWNAWYPGTNGVFVTADRRYVNPDNRFGFNTNDPNFARNFTVSGDFYFPVGKPVVAYISSLDVIHSFCVRPMRVTQDAIPGMSVPAWFKPNKEGTYQIQCAQLCGSGHYAMRGLIHVVSQDEYDKWLAKKTAAAAAAAAPAPPAAVSAPAK